MDMTEVARALLDPIPAHRTAGLRVLAAADGVGRVGLDVPLALTNVIGSLHSSGLMTLADAAGLAAMIGACETTTQFDGLLPLGRTATLSFHAPARGTLTATCLLSSDALTTLRSVLRRERHRASLETDCDITDSSGDVVCRGTFDWSVRVKLQSG